jgi:putative PIN family toxin of toxin-antitoxin system
LPLRWQRFDASVRVVLDTNIFVSGLLSAAGPPARIIQAVLQRRLIPVMSPETFAELEAVLRRPKLQRAFTRAGVNITSFLATIQAEVQFVDPHPTNTPLRDAQDRPFLDLMATTPPPQYFVTGDKDFEASHYSGVPVISAAEFARLLTHR